MMRIVVTGNRGMLGRDLELRLAQSGYVVMGLDLPELDISRPRDVLPSLRAIKPDLVINCAAYTAVDRAEGEPDLAFAVNRDGCANLAGACCSLAIPMIHLSTDYVFDGCCDRPYREDDAANPLNVYGMSKWEGEQAIRNRLAAHLIVRTSWLFGVHGSNFVKTILRLAREREELRVVADQCGCPTWTGDLARALGLMVDRIRRDLPVIQWGTYHFCGSGFTTWYDFATEILNRPRGQKAFEKIRVLPVTTAEYPTPAQRPRWSVLDCSKIQKAFGLGVQCWREGLDLTICEVCNGDRTGNGKPREAN